MGAASYMQNSFLGGEWGPFSQGQSNTQDYYTGMNLCLNYVPTDEGALTRRPGFRFSAEARANVVKLISFYTANGSSYVCEFTAGKLRFHTGGRLKTTNPITAPLVAAISTATPAVVETVTAHGYNTGDTVVFPEENLQPLTGSLLFNRQYRITVIDTTHFSLAHTGSLGTGSVDGSIFDDIPFSTETVEKVYEIDTPYSEAQLPLIKPSEEGNKLYLFNPNVETRILDGDTFDFSPSAFDDGPYLDQNKEATTLAFSAVSGSITVTASSTTGINDGAGFIASDVSRRIRVNSGTAADPDWTWLKITAVTDSTHVTATVAGPDLAATAATTLWRLGVYSSGIRPAHGVIHEGRLWVISDNFPGRIDGSKTFDFTNFEPTAQDGTVADDNAVSATAAGLGRKNFQWLQVTEEGLLAGADSSEWLIRASALDDPITPFTIQIRQVTNYGSADALPVRAGRSTLFIQSLGRALVEHRNEGQGFDGVDLARRARHLTPEGMAELAYSKAPVPIVWVRREDQRLIGVSYRNDPEGKQSAWHRHNVAWEDDPYDATKLAQGIHDFSNAAGPVLSIAVAPFSDPEVTRNDILWAATLRNGTASIEYMTPVFDDTKNPNEAFQVDSGNIYKHQSLGITWKLIDSATNTYRFYGMDRLVGDTVDMAFRGVDNGQAAVQSGGYADFAVDSALDVLASAYETTTETEVIYGDLTLNGGFVSQDYGPAKPEHPCPQSTIITGEDGKRYYVAQLMDTVNAVILADADTGSETITKTVASAYSEIVSAGIVPGAGWLTPNVLTSGGGSAVFTIPETPYVVLMWVQAGGVVSYHGFAYYKINSLGALELVGGYASKADGLDTQGDPRDVGAMGLVTSAASYGSGAAAYRYPIGIAYQGDTGHPSALTVIPSINYVAANTPILEDASSPWLAKGIDLGTFFDDNIIVPMDSPPSNRRNQGFFVPKRFCQLFYKYDIAEHIAGTAFVHSAWLDARDDTNPNGLISSIPVRFAADASAAFGGVGYTSGDARDDFGPHIAGYPFSDDTLDPTGAATTADKAYYCNPTVYPTDPSDVDKPWLLFFPKVFGDTTYRFYAGLKIYSYDPLTETAALVGGDQGELFTALPSGAADHRAATINVAWNRTSGQITFLMNFFSTGEQSFVVAEFGTFPVTLQSVTIPANIDAVIGLNYVSRAQLLRPDANSGARSGPALGKTRRTSDFSGLFYRTGQIKFGTKFTDLIALVLNDPDSIGRRPLFSGVSDIRALQDTYSFDSMMAWEQSRPDPGGIVSVAGRIQTQD